MFRIVIPPDVDVLDTTTEKPTGQKLKFVEFVRATLLTDRRFAASHEALEQQEAIRVALRGKAAGDDFELHNNDHSLLAEVAKAPQYGTGQQSSQGYGPVAYLCLPFIDAIKSAKKTEKKPAVEEDDAEVEESPTPPKKKQQQKLAAVDD